MRIYHLLFIVPTFIRRRHHNIISTITTYSYNNMLNQNEVTDLFQKLSEHSVGSIDKEAAALINNNNIEVFDEILQSLNSHFDSYLSPSNKNTLIIEVSKDDDKILENNNKLDMNENNLKKKRKLNEEEQEHDNNNIDILNDYIQQLNEIQQNLRRIKQEMKKKNKNDIKDDDSYHNLDRIHTIIKQLGRKLLQCVDAANHKHQQQQKSDVIEKKKSRVIIARNCNNKTNVEEEESVVDHNSTNDNNDNNYPNTVSIYLKRLLEQKKEVYKNPPILPLPPAIIFYYDGDDKKMYDSSFIPKRNSKTNTLCFIPNEKQLLYYDIHGLSTSTSNSNNKKKKTQEDNNNRKIIEEIFQNFNPNLTPEEVIRGGSFGGTYFRPIVSAVTNIKYNSNDIIQTTLESNWYKGLNIKTMLTNNTYNESINKYKKKCGGSLGMWESSGWINTIDPYGWFQWYCHFYRGRRTSDDIRQIQRWSALAGTKGRFKNQLLNKIYTSCPKGTKINDISISPVIRQTLFHWGIIITSDIFHTHIKNMKQKK